MDTSPFEAITLPSAVATAGGGCGDAAIGRRTATCDVRPDWCEC